MKKVFLGKMFIALVVMSCLGNSVLAQDLASIAPCRDGDQRPCGSGVGECEKGQTTCQGGIWGECENSVSPADEICDDGKDNDCNGLIDDCGFNTVSMILIGCGCMMLVVALIMSKMGK